MIRNLAILNVAEMFERFAYYGVRSILILFLVYGLTWSKADAADLYGIFTLAIYFASLAGGILADLTRKPALIAMIGNCLTTSGIFMLAFADSTVSIYIATGAIALGSGIFKPGMLVSVYRVSFAHKHRLDLILTIFYLAINLGAFAAPLVIGLFGDTGNPADFRTGFLIAGVCSLVPAILLLINYKNLVSNDLLYDNQTYRSSDIGITNVILYFFLTLIFWLAYVLFPAFISTSQSPASAIIMTAVAMIFYVILIPLHLIRNFRSALKISVGLAMVAFVCLVYPLLGLPAVSGLIMLGIAEVLIVPVLWSQIMQNVSPRVIGMIISLLMFMTVGINKVAGALYDTSITRQPVVLYVLASFCIILMVVFLILDHFLKKREQNLPQQLL